MSNDELFQNDYQDEEVYYSGLEEIKTLVVTRNEALYLSDSVTLLMEHISERGRIQIPVRNLLPQAGVPVPMEIIQKIGMAVLTTTDKDMIKSQANIVLSVADLYLLRECCQSFIKVNNELVGFNLLIKIYELILEKDIKERKFIEDITKDIDVSLVSRIEKLEELKEKFNNYKKYTEERRKDA